MDLRSYLNEKRRLVEAALEAALPAVDGFEKPLVEAMRYSLFADGKRLRPILCLAGAGAVGGRDADALPAAVALEMIHTYSLIHDDLPGMDNDDMRRGRPSNHKVFGEGMAILAGDGLLTAAFIQLASAVGEGGMSPDRAAKVTAIIAEAAGHRGMVGGQALDILSEGQAVDEDTIRYIHLHKTAALIAASVKAGAASAGGGPESLEALDRYGQKVGLAFQIVDDILDIEGEADQMGKSTGSDQARGKATYPGVVGLETARNLARELAAEAEASLAGFGDEAEPLRAIAGYLLTRNK